MEGHGEEMGFFEDQFNPNNIIVGESNEGSGSENNESVSIEDHIEGTSRINNNNNRVARRKRYHRHTPQQIQELENFFKEIAHPDEKQRLALGRRLGLESRQVKFWFQNRRTQMKTQTERHENATLKQDYDRLRLENLALREAARTVTCENCGGPVIFGELCNNDQQLRNENVRLKDELIQVSVVAEKFLGRPVSELASQIATDRNSGMGRLNGLIGSPTPVGPNLENGVSSNSLMSGSVVTSDYDKTLFMQVAMTAMDELLAMAQTDSPLWFKGLDEGNEFLNHDEYAKKFSNFVGMKPCGFIIDATRETGSMFITSLQLVDIMMLPRRYKDMFPCLVGKADTIEVLFAGNGGTRDGELQLMNVEFVYPSPFVPPRQEKILRFVKQHSEGMWAVVDVSLDMIREPSVPGSAMKWRRLPSGCIVQDIASGYSMVTWVEHVEYDENCIHQLYRSLLRSGMAFGAQRWLATLHRERDCVVVFMSSRHSFEANSAICHDGRTSIVKLMKRMGNNFCSGLCASSSRRWEKLQVGGLAADISIMSHVSINEPGEASGVVLSVSTSVWMPVSRQILYDFLRDEKLRGKWDMLADGDPMEVVASFPKNQDRGNCISLFCPPATPANGRNMVILQESWSDRTGSFIVFTPVDSSAMEPIIRGEDSDYMALLPSGFAICDGLIHPNTPTIHGGASVLTMGFQMLVNSLPTAKLTIDTLVTVNTLMSSTIQKIRESLGIN